jgi:RNA polymerase sigma factor (sigma-70 family)
MTDGQLLERFIAQRDDAAFEALVRRHGPMVLGVCRRVLRNDHDADDAFQATFLVLVHKAVGIRQRELFGNWLYGVAYRTALQARAGARRRRAHEKQVSPMPEPEAMDESILWRDLHPVLDREVNRLPEKYRVAIVLCDLEGGTRRDVARRLGIPLGTLSGRLTTAHRLLARRLGRRGLVLSSAALAWALAPNAMLAGVPEPLLASALDAARAVAVGQGVSAEATTLTGRGVMLLIKRKIAGGVVLAAVVLLGAGLSFYLTEDTSSPRAKILKLDARGRRVVWSPDGKTVAVVTKVEKTFLGFQYDRKGSAIRLWDVEKGQARQTLAENTDKGLAFGEVTFSADGNTIAATVSELVRQPNMLMIRDVIKLWDAKTLALKRTLVGDAQLVSVVLSPDGELVAAADPGKKKVKLWNARTGALEQTLDTGEAQPWSIAFSPDSKSLVIGGQAGVSGQIQLWEARTGTLRHVSKQDSYVNSVAFSANGEQFASGGGGDRIQLWDAHTGELVHSLRGLGSGTRRVAFSPDGKTVAAGGKDGKVRLWDVKTGNPRAALEGHRAEVYSVAFSPDGKRLASVSQDQTLRIWVIDNQN